MDKVLAQAGQVALARVAALGHLAVPRNTLAQALAVLEAQAGQEETVVQGVLAAPLVAQVRLVLQD